MRVKRIIVLTVIVAAILIAVPLMAFFRGRNDNINDGNKMNCLTLWQIDGFEGGRGSRAAFLKTVGEKCFAGQKTYLNIITLTADAARENLINKNVPDIISYPAGFYGIEGIINRRDFDYQTWCRGGYCLLSLKENEGITNVTPENTVINSGKDNLSGVAAALCGINGADYAAPTNAYLGLISGKYKHLLGTQRDVFRLITRGVEFSVKPITEFNDLYQNISIIAVGENYEKCKKYVEYLMDNNDLSNLGLFGKSSDKCEQRLYEMSLAKFDYKLDYPCGTAYIEQLKAAAANADINKIKLLLK